MLQNLSHLLSQIQRGDRVFLRGDLNVPIRDGQITDTNRLEAIMPTLTKLLDAGAVVTLATHLGRPQGHDPEFSTGPIAQYLKSNLTTPIHHIQEFPPAADYQQHLQDQSPGSVNLLENLRFDVREKTNDEDFAKLLISGCRYYVNDAFGCCHRAHASVSAITRFKPSFMGLLIEKEVQVLEEIRDQPQRPFWVISGGAKVRDKLGVLSQLAPRLDGVVCTGGLANTLLHGDGVDVGASVIEEDALDTIRDLLSGDVQIILPTDFIAGDQPFNPQETQSLVSGEPVPAHLSFFDIGPQSVNKICQHLSQAKTVFWNGPAGVFESAEFSSGTRTLAGFLAQLNARVVIGGGDSAAAVRQMNLADHFDHVSTGGGAALEFLEGKSLPGLVALETANSHDSESHDSESH